MFSKTFFGCFVVAAIAAIGTQATPVASGDEGLAVVRSDSESELFARADGNIYVCVHANFVAPCQNLGFNLGQCHNLGSPFQDSISSIGPDAGFRCFAFRDANCAGPSISIVSPGFSNLGSVSPNLNDQVSSYRCQRL